MGNTIVSSRESMEQTLRETTNKKEGKMTRDETRTLLAKLDREAEWFARNRPSMVAFTEGKHVEHSNDGGKTWSLLLNPSWTQECEYRAKPGPIRLYAFMCECHGANQFSWGVPKNCPDCNQPYTEFVQVEKP